MFTSQDYSYFSKDIGDVLEKKRYEKLFNKSKFVLLGESTTN
jgi:hypothetical protein